MNGHSFQIHVEVGAKSIKSKWDTGAVERAQGETQDRSQELDEIKKNVSVKERFKEKTAEEEAAEAAQRRSAILTEEPLDTTCMWWIGVWGLWVLP